MKKSKDVTKELVIEEAEEELFVSPNEMSKRIFGEQVSWVDKTVGEFIDFYKIQEKDLIQIVKRYVTGYGVPVSQIIENNKKIYREKAKSLSSSDELEVDKLDIVEELVKEYGFVVTDVKRINSERKIWKMRKTSKI